MTIQNTPTYAFPYPQGSDLADGPTQIAALATVDLFAAIGAALPDLRGRVPVGVDGAAGRLAANDTLSAVGGEESHTLASTEAAVASHGHGLNDPGHAHIAGSIGNSWAIIANAGGSGRGMAPLRFDVGTYQFQDASGLLGGATGAASTGQTVQNHNGAAAAAAHNTMQPFQVLNWIVKL
jgi:microcystin-dependent protein